MQKKRIALRNVQNVAASSTALIDCPIGPRYHQIILKHGFAAGTNTLTGAYANITEVRVKLNNRVQRVLSGTQLKDFNGLNGAAYSGNGVPNTAPGATMNIFFAEPWRENPLDKDALAWKTRGRGLLQVEVDIGAASTPTLAAFAIVDDDGGGASNVGSDAIVKIYRQLAANGGTSFDAILDRGRPDFLQQLTVYPDTGGSNVLTKVTLRANTDVKSEFDAAGVKEFLTSNGMVPAAGALNGSATRTAGIHDIVLDHDDLLGSAMPINNLADLNLTIEAGGSPSGTNAIIIARLGPPD